MTVLAEFWVESTALPIGRLVVEQPGMELEFDRLVPTGDAIAPYFWVRGDDLRQFEAALEASPLVVEYRRLDEFDDTALYRVGWRRDRGMLIQGITDTEGAVLRGTVTDEEMRFVVRFPDHDHLARFSDYCTDHDIPLHLERVLSMTGRAARTPGYDLTPEQREALELAIRRGYFRTPRQANLSDLADELGITQQALSERIRRGNVKVLTDVVLDPTDGRR